MKVKRLPLLIFSIILVIVLTILSYIGISFLQSRLLLPKDYIVWIFKYPISRLVFVFELYAYLVVFGLILYKKDSFITVVMKFAKRHRRWIYPSFILINIALIYALLFNITVITSTKIIDYSFFYPGGRVYNYDDIIKIDTGVYGDRIYIPLTHTKGEFYYVITLKDGREINLNDAIGGTKENKDRFIVFEELDNILVDMGIKKISSMKNFELAKNDLGKTYTDRIKNILSNVFI